MAEVAIGSEFAGHRIEGIAGRGGMGVVYRATHLALNRPVALKIIAPELAQDEGFRTRFKQESMTAASIDHPNVIPIYHAGEEAGQLYITMRYVDGTDLRAMIAQQGRLDVQLVAQIVSQVSAALDAAHARGLVHRDVKPANVLIAGGGAQTHAYLTDFGLTKHAASQSGLTKSGMFVGTLDYIAPEQLQGRAIDARADVYALGCVLYQALTGNVPYPRETEPAKIWAHMSEPPPSVTSVRGDVPVQFEDVVRRAMAKDPNDRYLSAGDLGRAVTAAAHAQTVTRAERSVATGDAAPSAATAVGPPPTAPQTAPPIQAPPPTGRPQWPPPAPPPGGYGPPQQGGGVPRWLLFVLGGIGVLVVGVVLALVLGGGGSSDKKKDTTPTVASNTVTTPTTPTTPTTGTTTIGPSGNFTGTKADIELTMTTTLQAARDKDEAVFCGGLTLRWENAEFGGPTSCEAKVKAGDIPAQFKTATSVSDIQVNGTKATATTDDGSKFSLVKGKNFWEIDGVS